MEKTNQYTNSNKRIMEKTTEAATRYPINNTLSQNISTNYAPSTSGGSSKESKVNWDEIAQRIGDQVGAKVAASIKNGQFVFEFDTTKSGGVYYWEPR